MFNTKLLWAFSVTAITFTRVVLGEVIVYCAYADDAKTCGAVCTSDEYLYARVENLDANNIGANLLILDDSGSTSSTSALNVQVSGISSTETLMRFSNPSNVKANQIFQVMVYDKSQGDTQSCTSNSDCAAWNCPTMMGSCSSGSRSVLSLPSAFANTDCPASNGDSGSDTSAGGSNTSKSGSNTSSGGTTAATDGTTAATDGTTAATDGTTAATDGTTAATDGTTAATDGTTAATDGTTAATGESVDGSTSGSIPSVYNNGNMYDV